MIRAVLFDLFNTLAESLPELVHTECDGLGLSPEEWSRYVWEPSLERDRGLGVIKTEEELVDCILRTLPFSVTEAQRRTVLLARRERKRRALCRIRPDVLETLRALRAAGYRTGLVSNADVMDIGAWAHSPLRPCFDFTVFSCNAGVVKPAPEIYRLALDALALSPQEALYVGDGGNEELQGAKAVGLRTVLSEQLIRRDGAFRERTLPYADHRIDRLAELLPLLSQIKREEQ